MTRPASACRFVVPPPGCHPSGVFRRLPLDRPGSPTRTLFTEPVGVENAPMEPQASPSNHGTAAADAAAACGGLHYIDVSGGVRSHDLPGGAHPLQPRAAWTRRRTAPRAAARSPLRPGPEGHLGVDFCGLRARVVHPDGRQGRRRACGPRRRDTAAGRAEIPPFLRISDKTAPPRKKTAGTAERYMLGW